MSDRRQAKWRWYLVSSAYKLEKLLERKGNRYCLVVVASRRARELNAGTPALIESEVQKTTSLALEEVLQGKIKYERRVKPPPKKAQEEKLLSPLEEKAAPPKATKKKKGEKEPIPKGSLREK
jgi:DNA-directed RNA polymerase subunit omega